MLSILTKIFSSFDPKQDPMKQRLSKILSVAEDIAKQNPDALRDFVKLLGRKLQSDYMCRAVSWQNEHRVPDLDPKLVWFNDISSLDSTGVRLFDLKKNANTTRTLSLASDLILPWPWDLGRVTSCLSCIGPGRPAGAWQQDPINHIVEYWLPFGIGWVHGGNHSIMAGIIQGQGTLTTNKVYDLSDIFQYVRFNGMEFIRESDHTVIQGASEFEFAAIFEIGRIMHKYGISA